MENVFLKYLSHMKYEPPQKKKEIEPFVTISREFGCEGNACAKLLVKAINERADNKKVNKEWFAIDKQTLHKSAEELSLHPNLISHVFKSGKRGFIADIITSFGGKYYISDERIINTISKVIKEIAEKGNVVIVGRASFILTKHIPKSLHIKLISPVEWRIKNVTGRFNLSYSEAKALINEIEKKRNAFLNLFKTSYADFNNFDIIYNREKFDNSEVVDNIINILEAKKLI